METIRLFDFYFPRLGRTKTIRVFHPNGFTGPALPVMYMHDGQNLWNPELCISGESWAMDETVARLSSHGHIAPMMVVGIDNSGEHRYDEYSPWQMKHLDKYKTGLEGEYGGEGFLYIQDLVEELKPHVDQNFDTISDFDHTGLGGSSMGGLISLAAGGRYPKAFGKILAMSTASWFAEEELLAFLKEHPVNPRSKVYLDVGTEETSNPDKSDFNRIYMDNSHNIAQVLAEAGHPDPRVKLVVDQGAQHSERFWAARLPAALEWLWAQ